MCDSCYAFDHNFDLCTQYVQLKVEIENSTKSAFNSMEHMMGEKISELVQKQNQCNFNKDEHTFEESSLGESCEKVVIKVSSPSPELIDLVAHTSCESGPAPCICSLPSPSLEYSLVKPIDDYVITDPNDDMGLVNIENNRFEGRVNEFYKSLGNYKWFNSLTDLYRLCIEGMHMKFMWTSLSHCFSDFPKAFDKLMRALVIVFLLCSLTCACLKCMPRCMLSFFEL